MGVWAAGNLSAQSTIHRKGSGFCYDSYFSAFQVLQLIRTTCDQLVNFVVWTVGIKLNRRIFTIGNLFVKTILLWNEESQFLYLIEVQYFSPFLKNFFHVCNIKSYVFQLLARQLLHLLREQQDFRRHGFESCLLLESDSNHPRDSVNHDVDAQRALREVAEYFNGYRLGASEVQVVHRYSNWSWIVR